jgi:hypothetical protein
MEWPNGDGGAPVPGVDVADVGEGAAQEIARKRKKANCCSPCSGYAYLPASWGTRDGSCRSKANQDFIRAMRAAVKAAAQRWADQDCKNKDGPECICVPIISGGRQPTTQNPWTKVYDEAKYNPKTGTCTIKIEYDYDGVCRKGKR